MERSLSGCALRGDRVQQFAPAHEARPIPRGEKLHHVLRKAPGRRDAANRCVPPPAVDAAWCAWVGGSGRSESAVVAHSARENGLRCDPATVWPEPCVTRGQPIPRTRSMSMPMTQDSAPQPGEAREPTALLAIGPEAKARVRILVVDDEHTLRESCAAVLRHEGYDVTVGSRGQDALELLKRRAFDVLLVDLYMSQVDGLALLRAALGTNHDTIVIVMTGNPSVESSVEALRQGAFDYLPKPFSASHLQVLIGRAVHT